MNVSKNVLLIAVLLCTTITCKSQSYFYYGFSNSFAWINGTDFCEGTERNMAMVGDRYRGGSDYNGAFGAVDSNGHLQFFHEYYTQYPYNKGLMLKSLTLTSDSCFLLAGKYYLSFSPLVYYPLLIKTTNTGNVIWAKYFTNSGDVSTIRKTGANENVLFLNNSTSPTMRLFKIDNSGNGINTATLSVVPNTADIYGKISEVMNDKGLIISGNLSNGIHSAYVMRTDSVYNSMWTISFPLKEVSSVIKTMDGGILLALAEESSLPGNSISVVKLNTTGTQVWSTTLIDSTRRFYEGSLVENSDSSVFLLAKWLQVNPSLYNYSVSFIKLSSNGTVISSMDSLRCQRLNGILKTSDGRYCTYMNTGTANTFRSAFLMTDSLFNTIPCINYLSVPSGYTVDYTMPTFSPFTTTTNFWGNATIAYTAVSLTDTLLLPMTAQPCYPTTSIDQVPEQGTINIYPNPASTTLNIVSQPYGKGTLSVYSILGQQLFSKNIEEGTSSKEMIIDISHFPSGLYFVTLIRDNAKVVKKFIKD